MSRRVLVGADDSPAAEAAVAFVAEVWPAAETTLLHVVDPTAAGYDAVGAPADTWFERERCSTRPPRRSRTARASVDRAVKVGRPAPVIVDLAEQRDADHVVVWSHGHTGLSRPVLGSVAEAVVRRLSVPVTVTAAPD